MNRSLQDALAHVGESIGDAYHSFNSMLPDNFTEYMEPHEKGWVVYRFDRESLPELEENYPWDEDHVVSVLNKELELLY